MISYTHILTFNCFFTFILGLLFPSSLILSSNYVHSHWASFYHNSLTHLFIIVQMFSNHILSSPPFTLTQTHFLLSPLLPGTAPTDSYSLWCPILQLCSLTPSLIISSTHFIPFCPFLTCILQDAAPIGPLSWNSVMYHSQTLAHVTHLNSLYAQSSPLFFNFLFISSPYFHFS